MGKITYSTNLSVGLIGYLADNPRRAVVVGPYKTGREVTHILASYNKARRRQVSLSQRKVLLVNPETLATERYALVHCCGAKNDPCPQSHPCRPPRRAPGKRVNP